MVIQGSKSDLFVQQKGVPQGSMLGPLLFSIFINDLPLICSNSSVQLYADDTVIYTSEPHLLQIQTALQSDFNNLQSWLLSNKLLLNKSTFYIMVFGTRHNLKSKSNNLILVCNDGTYLHQVDQTKY